MKRFNANKKCLLPLRVIIITLTVILVTVTVIFLNFLPPLMITLITIFITAGLFMSLIYLPVYIKRLRYYVSDNEIIKISGFYFITRQAMHIESIQYTSSLSIPWRKRINFLLINAYGGMMAIMFIDDNTLAELTYRLKL